MKVKDLNIENIVREKIDKPIFTKNDGMCAGIAEKEYGALKDCNNGVFLGIGTGIGTAVFIHGKLIEDIRGAGHMIIQRDGKRCQCGKNGCYEAYASMKAFKTRIRQVLGNDGISSKEILNLLTKLDRNKQLEDVINDYIDYLAIGISNMARIFSADVIVLGGSFVYYKDILFQKLQIDLDRIMDPIEKQKVRVKLAELGNDAGIIGATII